MVMNPLAEWLVSKLRAEPNVGTRAFAEYNEALNELGYWILQRPRTHTLEQMPRSAITEECLHVLEFESYYPPWHTFEGFNVIVSVWAERSVCEEVSL